MARAVKVTISLPGDMLEQIEQERRARHETRSEFVRAMVEETFRGRHEQDKRARYVRGYEQGPETAEEIAAADRLGCRVPSAEPWE